MSGKASCWSITINNPTDDDNIQWAALRNLPWVKEVKGQLEKGENDTPHIQGMVRTEHIRFSQIKRALPRAHIEPAKNTQALSNYVQKVDTRVGTIPQVRVATQKDVQDTICELVSTYGKQKYGDNFSIENIYFNQDEWLVGKDWEYWLDQSVNKLIIEGFYGVEFVMSNPQIRNAFKKYFVSILIRTHKTLTHKTDGRTDGQDLD